MRAALVVLVVGCSSQGEPLTIDVVTSPTEVTWYISPGASCTCTNVATFPTSGTIDLGYYTSYTVLTLRGPTTTASGSFTFHLWATN